MGWTKSTRAAGQAQQACRRKEQLCNTNADIVPEIAHSVLIIRCKMHQLCYKSARYLLDRHVGWVSGAGDGWTSCRHRRCHRLHATSKCFVTTVWYTIIHICYRRVELDFAHCACMVVYLRTRCTTRAMRVWVPMRVTFDANQPKSDQTFGIYTFKLL
jgi:hypothetical protein